MTSLHLETHSGLVALTVANRECSVAFYQDVLGFTVIERGNADVILAAEATTLLLLLTEAATIIISGSTPGRVMEGRSRHQIWRDCASFALSFQLKKNSRM